MNRYLQQKLIVSLCRPPAFNTRLLRGRMNEIFIRRGRRLFAISKVVIFVDRESQMIYNTTIYTTTGRHIHIPNRIIFLGHLDRYNKTISGLYEGEAADDFIFYPKRITGQGIVNLVTAERRDAALSHLYQIVKGTPTEKQIAISAAMQLEGD